MNFEYIEVKNNRNVEIVGETSQIYKLKDVLEQLEVEFQQRTYTTNKELQLEFDITELFEHLTLYFKWK